MGYQNRTTSFAIDRNCMISVTRTRRYKQTWILYHETEQSINRLPLSFRPERTGLNPFAATA